VRGYGGTWRPHLAVIKRAIKIKVRNERGKGQREGGARKEPQGKTEKGVRGVQGLVK
jgi:hypothetical protein